MKLPVYLDYSATTPVDPKVARKMMRCLMLDGTFGNPDSRSHIYGWQAEECVDTARYYIADLIGADPREIFFTSGVTESNNLALKGIAYANRNRGRHIITAVTEHKSIISTCLHLSEEGFNITWLTPSKNGLITSKQLLSVIKKDTILVSLMHANNETGILNDIETFGTICRAKNILFHVDASQSVGKLPINLSLLPVDLMSLSSHKIYGPKGIGALFLRLKSKIQIKAQIHGGGHQSGIRSGTLPVHQIVGMGEAYRLAKKEISNEIPRLRMLRDRLWFNLKKVGNVSLNGNLERGIVTLLNFSLHDISSESFIMALAKDLAVSSGAACISSTTTPSYVLRAMGISDEHARNAVRFSLGRFTTLNEIDYVIEKIQRVVPLLRKQC